MDHFINAKYLSNFYLVEKIKSRFSAFPGAAGKKRTPVYVIILCNDFEIIILDKKSQNQLAHLVLTASLRPPYAELALDEESQRFHIVLGANRITPPERNETRIALEPTPQSSAYESKEELKKMVDIFNEECQKMLRQFDGPAKRVGGQKALSDIDTANPYCQDFAELMPGKRRQISEPVLTEQSNVSYNRPKNSSMDHGEYTFTTAGRGGGGGGGPDSGIVDDMNQIRNEVQYVDARVPPPSAPWWLREDLSSELVKTWVQQQPDGYFLIRRSDKDSGYTLVVAIKHKALKLKIQYHNGWYSLPTETESKKVAFQSLLQLVQHYQGNPMMVTGTATYLTMDDFSAA